ncbi:hypothetical protein VIGAN_01404500, partial [Vigna angularis var. angularis]
PRLILDCSNLSFNSLMKFFNLIVLPMTTPSPNTITLTQLPSSSCITQLQKKPPLNRLLTPFHSEHHLSKL